jgi:hypothetical protein
MVAVLVEVASSLTGRELLRLSGVPRNCGFLAQRYGVSGNQHAVPTHLASVEWLKLTPVPEENDTP